ncbi:MFS transporter [Hahella sp. KA22]|uniref:MFS transporter n=1 Tax=Hahella sp. KA22 TaxID=1628392 RepID=UPI000FDE800E|nr:MFS transporter [Hahella sp. KA22]AZZ92530.1 MFS transporter [Hahella sp. KA22]QAY55903.1 MFS transporter [Hahella sp. KA22]
MTNIRMLSLIGIYLVIFIDNLGASLIIPMLTPIAHDPVAGLISEGSEGFRNGVYGVALGAFSIAMFFGAPLLGALSDGLGRKKTLLLCLSGLAMSYVFLALALAFKSLWLFMAGRLIGGFFSGSLPVAQASIIDVTEEKQRARYIGYIMFFVSLGYVVGPLIGGYLSDPALVPWFNLQTPFIFVAALSVVNLLILLLVFQDQKRDVESRAMALPNPIANLLDAVRIKDIRTYALLLLLMLVGWNTFFQFIGLYLTGGLGFGQQEVSSFVSWVGFGLAAAFLFLVGAAMKMLKPLGMVGLALTLMALCIGGTLLSTHPYALYLLAVLGAVGFGLSYSGLMAQLSISVDASRQGSMMGMAAAIAAFSAGFSGFAFGFVANISVNAPIVSALLCVCLAILVCCKEQLSLTRQVKYAD